MKPTRRRGRRGAPKPRPVSLGVTEVTIASLGARGDGVGQYDGKPVYVPFSLPGELLRARLMEERGEGLSAEPLEVLRPSADRVDPPCRHFADPKGACGGCTIQHLSLVAAADFKRQLVHEALTRRGFDGDLVAATVSVPPGQRRRASFAVRGGRGAPRIGFHERDSSHIIAIGTCPALVPEIAALTAPLRDLLAGIAAAGKGGSVEVLQSETGLDIVLGFPGEPDLRERERLAAFAAEYNIARLSWRYDDTEAPLPIAVQCQPLVSFSAIPIVPPPGAFLQASRAGQEAIVEAITNSLAGRLSKAGRLADLFAGCGTMTFALATLGRVHAVEENAEMVAAITLAAGQGGLGGRVSAEKRDLFRRPLAGRELTDLDALVFDPPRAGALEQARAIADAGAPALVVAVSCNPATFARDARVLADGGFALKSVIPIDQFPWSSHVELVATLEKET